MQTEVQKIGERSLARAKELLLRGECVAFPTETVYGLGADARSDEAVERIYRVKGRPQDNPLIVHVHQGFDLGSLVYDEAVRAKTARGVPARAADARLSQPRQGQRKGLLRAGYARGARAGASGGAGAFSATSISPSRLRPPTVSKHVSPVSAQHVLDDLNGKIPLILDGGPCSGGIESTVCDITGPYPVILRAGLVTREMIAGVVGRCDEYIPQEGEKVRSPGMKYKHYAPSCETKLFAPADAAAALAEYRRAVQGGRRVRVLCEDAVAGMFPAEAVLDLGADGAAMAENLYRLLREAETCADLLIAIEPAERGGVMTGVLNRLRKACAGE